MRLWELESALGELEAVFENGKIELEQYPTSAHLAARIVHVADSTFDDIQNKNIVDLGTGTAVLACACALSGAGHVLGIDIDVDALAMAEKNREKINAQDTIDFVCADIHKSLPLQTKRAHTCIQNPPFGTRLKGADVIFVKAAIASVTCAVYSLHKTSTRDFILANANNWGAKGGAAVLAELVFDIPKLYDFHTKQSADIRVDLIRFDVDGTSPSVHHPLPPPASSQRGNQSRDHKGRGGRGGHRGHIRNGRSKKK
uniref:Methyltransferase small domain-containing protein n=1 Tax=Aureoumbra lagunensis TaxID=44058 RepID=A0A7S3JT13_9STRA